MLCGKTILEIYTSYIRCPPCIFVLISFCHYDKISVVISLRVERVVWISRSTQAEKHGRGRLFTHAASRKQRERGRNRRKSLLRAYFSDLLPLASTSQSPIINSLMKSKFPWFSSSEHWCSTMPSTHEPFIGYILCCEHDIYWVGTKFCHIDLI